MDLTGFELLRETLRPHLGPGAAHREAQRLLPRLRRAMRNGVPVQQELTALGRDTLTESVQRAFEGVADEVRYYYAAEPFGHDHWDRGVANREVWDGLSLYVQTVEILVPRLLEAIGEEDPLGALKHTAGALLGKGAGDEYPLCIQDAAGKPVTVYFPGVVRRITSEAPTLAPEFWKDETVPEFEDPLGLVSDVLLEKREPPSDAEWFQWLYQATVILVDILGGLAAMQWIVGELAAGYFGIGQPEVEAIMGHLTSKFDDDSADEHSSPRHLRWKLEAHERTEVTDEVDVATGIRLVGKALRHAMLDEPFNVPVVSTRIHEDPNGQLNRLTVTVNHPLLGVGDATSAVRQGLGDLRELDFHSSLLFSNEETAFLEAIDSLRSDHSLRRDDRVPHGFWANLTRIWNVDHPEDQLTENAARVRHHRLKNRKRSWKAT
jgi:hypothetical protein